MTEGTILEWRRKVGETIKRDETIVEISTDKVDVELPAPASGTIAEILVNEGETVTVGQVIARIAVGRGRCARRATRDARPGHARWGWIRARPAGRRRPARHPRPPSRSPRRPPA